MYYILAMSKKSAPKKTEAAIEEELQAMRRADQFIGMRAERDEANYRKEKAERELRAVRLELQAVKASRTWKTGRVVLAPYRWIARKK
jgi:hypothetical protein